MYAMCIHHQETSFHFWLDTPAELTVVQYRYTTLVVSAGLSSPTTFNRRHKIHGCLLPELIDSRFIDCRRWMQYNK